MSFLSSQELSRIDGKHVSDHKFHGTSFMTAIDQKMVSGFYGGLEGNNSVVKESWPELVGLMAAEAEKKIKEEKPGVVVQVIGPNCFTTMDFNTGRVRLHVDSSGKVERPPRIG